MRGTARAAPAPFAGGVACARCYTRGRRTHRPAREGDVIKEALRSAWQRFTRKQLLFIYPLVVGIVNMVAFFAVYSVLGGRLDFSDFAETNFTRWTYLQEHAGDLTGAVDNAVVVLVAAAAVCFLTAGIRAPYFRAITSSSYPRAPQSLGELVRLAGFYAATGAIFYLIPFSFDLESVVGQVVSLLLLPVAILLIFGDYIVVFERLGPVAAARRSLQLARRGWMVVIPIYLAALLMWTGAFALFDRYYETADGVFPLFVVSQLLVEALIALILDLVLIYTYDYLRRL